MRLDWALLANAAEAPPNGLVYILGAGFDTLVRDKFPTPFGGVIVLRLQTTRLETERPHKVEAHCADEDGKLVLPNPIGLKLPARQGAADYAHGWDLSGRIVINLASVPIERPGLYHLEIADGWFRRWGLLAVFVGRVLPVIRTYISFPAGLARIDLTRFSMLTFVGALPWCAALALVGYVLGRNYDRISGPLEKGAIAIALLVVIAVIAWYVRGREPARREA